MSAKTPRLLATLSRHYRVERANGFSLKHDDPDDTRGLEGLKDESDAQLQVARAALESEEPGPSRRGKRRTV